MAGYAVECALKALILSTVLRKQLKVVVDSFRGNLAHDYDWLRSQYYRRGGTKLPDEIATEFSRVNSWTTNLRYRPGAISIQEARVFVDATRSIVSWTEGRVK